MHLVARAGEIVAMLDSLKRPLSYVVGLDGSPLTLRDLAPDHTKRWSIRRKAEFQNERLPEIQQRRI
jgi:hypothetical protein